MRFNDSLGEQFDKRIAEMQRTTAISYAIWTVFALGVFGTLGAVAVHFLRKVW